MKLSVALCTYNGEKFLKSQIDSILQQTQKVDEIVVCDDISSDKTLEILRKYEKEYPNIFKIYCNEINLGSSKNFEKALQCCSGDYIFFSDQDDLWRHDKVEKTLTIFQNYPDTLGVFSDANLIDEQNNVMFDATLSLWSSVKFFPDLMPENSTLFDSLVCMGNFLTGATLCVHKDIKNNALPFKIADKLSFIHDEWLAFLMSSQNNIRYTAEKLIDYRLHSNQQLGVGNIRKIKHRFKKAHIYYHLMLNRLPRYHFFAFIKKKRTLFNQFVKYSGLNDLYQDPLFNKAKQMLYNELENLDNTYKKQNPVLFYFRTLTDYVQGKRKYQ